MNKLKITKHLFILSFLFLIFGYVSGQEISFSCAIKWSTPYEMTDPFSGNNNFYFAFENAVYNDPTSRLPFYEDKIKLPDSNRKNFQVSILQPFYEEVPASDIGKISPLPDINDTILINTALVTERKEPYLRYSFIPLKRNKVTGKVERLKYFTLRITLNQSVMPTKSTQSTLRYASQSVLNSGDWYKFQVSQSGVYQISYQDLKNIGVKNPENVRIYGNGGKSLPEIYSGNVPDDLNEIPVTMFTGPDGIFNDGDYIIFYAEGPVTWTYNKTNDKFAHHKNSFVDKVSYFITSAPGGKRITIADSPSGNSNTEVNSFDGLDYHEVNSSNLIQSGQDWYGETFGSQSYYNFLFKFPGLIKTEPVKFESRILGRSDNSTTFSFAQNGQLFGSVNINPTITSSTVADYANISTLNQSFSTNSENITIQVSYNQNGDPAAEGWLDYLRLRVRQNLSISATQLLFRDTRSLGQDNIATFKISNAYSNLVVWNISDINNVTQMNGQNQNNIFSFKAAASDLQEYIAFDPKNGLLSPEFTTDNQMIVNQNLHGLKNKDLIIVSPPDFQAQAQELADLHAQNDGLSTIVVTPYQIYNEFSSGMPDPAAIRNFMKMLYDRAASSSEAPKYLLLFGDGSYNNKNSGTTLNPQSLIITYESNNSLSPSDSYVSDDYFGLLDDNEDINYGLLDVGVGRLPVGTVDQAKDIVAKIKKYTAASSLGDWRNNICFIADDEDNNVHMQQADSLTNMVKRAAPFLNIEKIYIDAYQQVSTSIGQRYPEVNTAITNQLNRGTLILNYTGHGGVRGLAQEQIMRQNEDIKMWRNSNYPLFITATCDFSRFDNFEETTAGEDVLLNANGGGIGLLTTTRLVYSGPNFVLNQQFYRHAFVKTDDNPAYRLGDIMRKTKNTSGVNVNKLCFTLLGDPALSLNIPKYNIITDSINHHPAGLADTLKAYGEVNIYGHIVNESGNPVNTFNGIVYPVIFDKNRKITTLANDGFDPFNFYLQNNVLYRGQASVKNGTFTVQTYLPRDINYNFGAGRISYYAQNNTTDASGYFSEVTIGGITTNTISDTSGPQISLYMNDTTFVNGGITNSSPTLLAKISDNFGINPGGNSLGHDIVAVLDNDTKNSYILNSYLQTELNNIKKGTVQFNFTGITPGDHVVSFKVWDIFNNSSQSELKFKVLEGNNLQIRNTGNYPNPFTDHTYFFFQHNQPSVTLDVTVEIFNLAGSKIKVLNTSIYPPGYTSEPLFWNGADNNGNKITPGIYLYRIILRSLSDTAISETKKLVVIN
ncbi:MAG: type IX secretion system sortase PorU [Bacteroidota bacterium]|nr:type IX secretion system sortase PorU [Bacteroidota bacterium]